MTKTNNNDISKVVVSATAFLSISMHSMTHSTKAVHGVLVGKFNDTEKLIKVSDAVPICHGTPTTPLLETALSLVQNLPAYEKLSIVGWYTSPELLNDDRPGPVALRIVSNLALAKEEGQKQDPVLLVMRNGPFGKLLSGEEGEEEAIQAFGKDFGKQWLEPLETVISNKSQAVDTVKDARNQKVKVNDLVDHLESSASAKWYHSDSLLAGLGLTAMDEDNEDEVIG